jgi:fatty acid desaturase
VTLLLIVSGLLLTIARLLAVCGLAVALLLAVGWAVAALGRAAAVVILVGHVFSDVVSVL